MNQQCKVCGEPAAGFHFGAFTCEGCKSFFGRTYNNVSGVSECKNGGRCEITKKNRTSCKSCRLRKCLSVGMSKSGSRYGRRSNWFKIHCLLQAQNGGSGPGPGSGGGDNNNNLSSTNNNLKGLPSSMTSLGSNSSDSDRDERHHHGSSTGGHGGKNDRSPSDRTASSSASRNYINNGPYGGHPHGAFAGLSPEAREQLMTSINRNLTNPDICEYLRQANMNGQAQAHAQAMLNMSLGKSFFPMVDDDRENSSIRTTQTPGSLESPNSDISTDEKRSTPMIYPGTPGSGAGSHNSAANSPLDHNMKPNDLLSFDLLARDLMKLGYDPLRLWPAMFTASQPGNLNPAASLHQAFNPYRFMFPGAGGAGLHGFPSLPPNLTPPSATLLNGKSSSNHNHSSSRHSSSPISLTSKDHHRDHRDHHRDRDYKDIKHKIPLPPAVLTPPASSQGDDSPLNFIKKFTPPPTKPQPIQEKPIDLSAKNNNNEGECGDADGDDEDLEIDEDDTLLMIKRRQEMLLKMQMAMGLNIHSSNSDGEDHEDQDHDDRESIKSSNSRNSRHSGSIRSPINQNQATNGSFHEDSDGGNSNSGGEVVHEEERENEEPRLHRRKSKPISSISSTNTNNNNRFISNNNLISRRRSGSPIPSPICSSPKRDRVSTPLDLTRTPPQPLAT